MRALQARGTGIETRILHHFVTIRVALVAQMVERKTLNLVVVGSIPTEGVFLQLDASKLVMQHYQLHLRNTVAPVA